MFRKVKEMLGKVMIGMFILVSDKYIFILVIYFLMYYCCKIL